MKTGKTGKYFKYALGEIILVVIGILIALQINNWNEEKKINEKERQVLTEIVSDLEFTLQELDRVINKRTNNLHRTINSLKTIIKVLESDQSYNDSLASHFRAINSYDQINFKTSGYQSLVSIGTDLIEDPKLRSAIGEFHTSSITETKSGFDVIDSDFYSYMMDYYRKQFTTEFDENAHEILIPNDFDALKKDKVYLQSLKAFLSINEPYLDTLNRVQDDAEQLKQNIENYLN